MRKNFSVKEKWQKQNEKNKFTKLLFFLKKNISLNRRWRKVRKEKRRKIEIEFSRPIIKPPTIEPISVTSISTKHFSLSVFVRF